MGWRWMVGSKQGWVTGRGGREREAEGGGGSARTGRRSVVVRITAKRHRPIFLPLARTKRQLVSLLFREYRTFNLPGAVRLRDALPFTRNPYTVRQLSHRYRSRPRSHSQSRTCSRSHSRSRVLFLPFYATVRLTLKKKVTSRIPTAFFLSSFLFYFAFHFSYTTRRGKEDATMSLMLPFISFRYFVHTAHSFQTTRITYGKLRGRRRHSLLHQMPSDDTRPRQLRTTSSIRMPATGRQERSRACITHDARFTDHRFLSGDTERGRVLQFAGATE